MSAAPTIEAAIRELELMQADLERELLRSEAAVRAGQKARA